jgi:hypothetical protein
MGEPIEEKSHAKRSPSSAKRRKLCPGSPVMEEGRPDNPSRFAAEGTVAHTVMELCLQPVVEASELGLAEEATDAEAFVGRIFEADGFEFTVDMEMADHVNSFVQWVLTFYNAERGDVLLTEQAVSLEPITGEKDATGTADVIILGGDKRIYVFDLKYGAGVLVLVTDSDGQRNEQLVSYGVAAALQHGEENWNELVIGIGQPRKDYFDFDTIDMTLEFGGELARLREIEALVDEAEAVWPLAKSGWEEMYLHPSEDACKFCKAKGSFCPAQRREIAETVSAVATPDDFADLEVANVKADKPGPNWLAVAYSKVDWIEDWCAEVRAEMRAALMAGTDVPGYYMTAGKKGNRAWTDEIEAAARMRSARLKQDEMFSSKLISPTQAEQLLKDKPKVWTKLTALITQSEGQPAITHEGSGKARLNLAASLDDFGDIEDGSDLI